MVSQFISPDNVNLLGSLNFHFAEGTHALGRLDNNSEGLLLLTTNKAITKLLFSSTVPHLRTYYVQVEKVMNENTADILRNGIKIKGKGGLDYTSAPCNIEIVSKPLWLLPRKHEFRDDLPHSWIKITLTEGKFHQIRKMVSLVHHHCKRLVRYSIEDLTLDGILPSEVKEISEQDFFVKLKLGSPL